MRVKKRKSKLIGISMLLNLVILFVACNQEELKAVSSENFTDSTITELQTRAVGKAHCLEFVFPISIAFVDGSSAEVSSYKLMKSAINEWFAANDVEKSKENRPDLVFPIQVLNQDGDIHEVDSQDELKSLRSECASEGRVGRKGKRGGKGFKCFSLQYPVTINIGGEDVTFDDRQSMKAALKAYKETAGEDSVKPSLAFPVTVELDDDTEQVINDQDELDALKESCKENSSRCFTLAYPVSVNFDGETTAFDDRRSMKKAIREYRKTAGPNAEKPSLVFPLDVTLEDGSTQTINSQEELDTLREGC